MKRFKNILFVVDGAPEEVPALSRAMKLAKGNDARLTLIQVIDDDFADSMAGIVLDSITSLQTAWAEKRQKKIEELIEKAKEDTPDVTPELIVKRGKAFIEVIRAVLTQNFDLVIKAVDSNLGSSRIFFSSTDLHLLRKCPCPLWLVKADGSGQYKNILAAVDPVQVASKDESINKLILDLASSLATMDSAVLHIVHTWHTVGRLIKEDPRLEYLGHTKNEIDKLTKEVQALHQSKLEKLLKGYPINFMLHFMEGNAGDVITSLAEEHDVDLIVMGTVARSGIPGFLIGNTAEKVLHRVHCSVLTVKPDGFITPVEP